MPLRRPFLSRSLLVVSALVTALPACGSASSAGAAADGGASSTCPEPAASAVTASACATATPSYANVIVPILQAECLSCHGPGGIAGYDESTYAKVYAQRSAILDQVSACLMPPANGPQVSSAQLVALDTWLECGAPDN